MLELQHCYAVVIDLVDIDDINLSDVSDHSTLDDSDPVNSTIKKTMKNKKKTIAYLRVSKDSQDLDNQKL